MRDGDDSSGFEQEPGKIFYPEFPDGGDLSGEDRADYGLPPGMSALEGYGPEIERQAEPMNPQIDRRKLVLGGLGLCLIGGLGGGLVGSRLFSPADETRRAPKDKAAKKEKPASLPALSDIQKLLLRNARKLAKGRIQDLVAYFRDYIHTVEFLPAPYNRDPELWVGMERLTQAVLDTPGDSGYRMAKHLLATFDIQPPPKSMRSHWTQLRWVVTAWESRRQGR